jgi:hypothetical protein
MPGDPGYRCPRCGTDRDRPDVETTQGRLVLVHTVDNGELVGVCEACVAFDEWLLNTPGEGAWT